MNKDTEELFKVLGNDVRLSVIKLLLKKEELSCQDIQKHFTLSQPTMSHHFSQLIDAGIIKVRKMGANHFYSLDQKLLEKHGIYFSKKIKLAYLKGGKN